MTQHSDDGLLKTLSAAWEREPRIDLHHYPIQAALRDGELSLVGIAPDIAAKKLACSVARRLAPDLRITDRLRLEPVDGRRQGKLRDAVTRSLLHEPAFAEYGVRAKRDLLMETLREPRGDPARSIDLVIDEGVVILVGEVGSLMHRCLAEVLAWWAGGCEDVQNNLRVMPPEEENDGELGDAVRMVLEKDPLVHEGQVSIRVRQGRVTLEGLVSSEEEARLAGLDAWYVPGVEEVDNRIRTRA